MLRMRPGEKAWLTLAAGVIAYELFAKDGELMSEIVDHWLQKHRVATTVAITVTAAHLLNWLPPKIDPYHRATAIRIRRGRA